MWAAVQAKYRNSVLQLWVTVSDHDIAMPFRTPKTYTAKGSGFFIDAPNGILVTNAHVDEDAVSVVGRVQALGQIDLRMRPISLCREKDISLCQLFQEDLKILEAKVGDLSKLSMEFGDNFELRETNPVLAIGYPLGEMAIKFTEGTTSGFYPNLDSDDDSIETFEDSPSYIQISAAVNPGNSGGPVVDRNGRVIGVAAAGRLFSQSTAYAIGARTIQSILAAALSPLGGQLSAPSLGTDTGLIPTGGMKVDGKVFPLILHTPKVSFEWCESNKALIRTLVPPAELDKTTGIYVTKVYPNSCLEKLQAGDLIVYIEADLTIDCSLPGGLKGESCGRQIISGTIDNYGDIDVGNISRGGPGQAKSVGASQTKLQPEVKTSADLLPTTGSLVLPFGSPPRGTPLYASSPESNSQSTPFQRKLALKELLDVIPIGNRLAVHIWREGKKYKLETKFLEVTGPGKVPLMEMYLHFEPLDYEIVGGMVITPLTYNYIDSTDELKSYAQGDKRFQRYLIVTRILPNTEAKRAKSIHKGQVIETVNNHKVHSMAELRAILKSIPEDGVVVIKMHKGGIFAVDLAQMKREDKTLLAVLGVPTSHPYVLD